MFGISNRIMFFFDFQKSELEQKLSSQRTEMLKIKKKYAKAVARYNARFADLQPNGTYTYKQRNTDKSKRTERENDKLKHYKNDSVTDKSDGSCYKFSTCFVQEIHPKMRPRTLSKVTMHSSKRRTLNDQTEDGEHAPKLQHSMSDSNISIRNNHYMSISPVTKRRISSPSMGDGQIQISNVQGVTRDLNDVISYGTCQSFIHNKYAKQTVNNAMPEAAIEQRLIDLEHLLSFDTGSITIDVSGSETDDSSDSNSDFEFECT